MWRRIKLFFFFQNTQKTIEWNLMIFQEPIRNSRVFQQIRLDQIFFWRTRVSPRLLIFCKSFSSLRHKNPNEKQWPDVIKIISCKKETQEMNRTNFWFFKIGNIKHKKDWWISQKTADKKCRCPNSRRGLPLLPEKKGEVAREKSAEVAGERIIKERGREWYFNFF